jgi:hypothetical protein
VDAYNDELSSWPPVIACVVAARYYMCASHLTTPGAAAAAVAAAAAAQGDHGVLHQHDVGHTGAAQHMASHQRATAKVRGGVSNML